MLSTRQLLPPQVSAAVLYYSKDVRVAFTGSNKIDAAFTPR